MARTEKDFVRLLQGMDRKTRSPPTKTAEDLHAFLVKFEKYEEKLRQTASGYEADRVMQMIRDIDNVYQDMGGRPKSQAVSRQSSVAVHHVLHKLRHIYGMPGGRDLLVMELFGDFGHRNHEDTKVSTQSRHASKTSVTSGIRRTMTPPTPPRSKKKREKRGLGYEDWLASQSSTYKERDARDRIKTNRARQIPRVKRNDDDDTDYSDYNDASDFTASDPDDTEDEGGWESTEDEDEEGEWKSSDRGMNEETEDEGGWESTEDERESKRRRHQGDPDWYLDVDDSD